jgi:uncharacterized protein (DUF983 family)
MADQRGSSTTDRPASSAGAAPAKSPKPPKASWSRPKPARAVPRAPIVRTMVRGFTKRCANCGSGHLFHGYFRMVERCPRCGLKFHRQEGQWSGDIGANTIVTFALLWVVLVIGSLLTWDDPKLPLLAGMALAVVVLFPPFFIPYAKTLWVAVDVLMRPVEPDELVVPQGTDRGAPLEEPAPDNAPRPPGG